MDLYLVFGAQGIQVVEVLLSAAVLEDRRSPIHQYQRLPSRESLAQVLLLLARAPIDHTNRSYERLSRLGLLDLETHNSEVDVVYLLLSWVEAGCVVDARACSETSTRVVRDFVRRVKGEEARRVVVQEEADD